jgi:selenocysteine lyase/cysteine desulfurase
VTLVPPDVAPIDPSPAPPRTPVGPAEFREHFPVLTDTVHLACCSLAPRSRALDGAMRRMLEALHEDPTPWDLWYAEVEQGRRRFARLVGADAEQVAVVPSATVGAFQVASTLDWSDRPGIVATDADYSSVAQTWLAQRPRGARVSVVPEVDAQVSAADYAAALDGRTGLVSVPLVSYRTGSRLPVIEIADTAEAVGARVFVDAYQALGVLPVDVRELGCDYLVSGVMKYLLGLPGVAYLYVRDGVRDHLDPQLTGFLGRADPLAFDPEALDFPADARRFQIGIPTLPVALAANAGLGLVGELDAHAVERHVTGLAQRATARLRADGVPLLLPEDPARRGPQVAVGDPDPMGLARFLNERRIFPARGHLVRLSFHHYSSTEDVDTACAAIAQWSARR